MYKHDSNYYNQSRRMSPCAKPRCNSAMQSTTTHMPLSSFLTFFCSLPIFISVMLHLQHTRPMQEIE